MNIGRFYKNIIYLIKTSSYKKEVFGKLYWLYNVHNKLGRNEVLRTKFYFKYPGLIGLIRLVVRNNNGSDAFILSEIFEHECYKIESYQDSEDLVIMDIGANAGFTAIYFSRTLKPSKIICVEPIPDNIEILKCNLSINNVNATIYEAAISTIDGKVEMELNNKDYGHKVHNIEYGKNISDKLLTVNAVSINTIIKELGISSIDILKIDIEGYEGVLFSENIEWLERVDTIIMEIHENVSVPDIISTLKEYSFLNFYQEKGNWIFQKNLQL